MPVLIDGNNLLYAALELEDPERPVSRSRLCRILGNWARKRAEQVHVVFDGPTPRESLARQIADPSITVEYSGGASADARLVQILESDSAARRLIVVSSDRAIARAAKRRRAKPARANEFWIAVKRDLAQPSPEPLEPPEKHGGLDPGAADDWLREFGWEDS